MKPGRTALVIIGGVALLVALSVLLRWPRSWYEKSNGSETSEPGPGKPGSTGKPPGLGPAVANLGDKLDRYLSGKQSPIRERGAVFVERGQKWDVDPRLIVAISGAESSFGRKICGDFNAWNWFWCYAVGTCEGHPCQNSPFDSWDKGIYTVTKFMRRSYLNKGYTSIPLIRQKYCIENCEHWERNVTTFYHNDLSGSLHDFTYPADTGPR